jgi:hypothetical protein
MRPGSIALMVVFSATVPVFAQEAFNHRLPQSQSPTTVAGGNPAPHSAWIDLRQSAAARFSTQSAPSWIEAVSMVPTGSMEGNANTVFRIRLGRPPGDYRVLFFRLFFDDKPDARPELVAWDESGTQVLRSGELGAGIDLPSSDSVMVPMDGISTIDIEVPGNGKTVRGAYVDWMGSSEVVHPLNAERRDVIPEPFSSMPPLHSPTHDTEQFGTVTASLADEVIPIGPTISEGGAFQFGIESQPLLALLTFEVASPRVDAPPEVYLNGEDLGSATITLPELADPGYRGQAQPLVNEMHFQYTGWLRVQKIVPGSSLKVGTNDLIVVGGAGTSASAVRATQIQLKYLWDKSDYVLEPSR